MTGRTFAEKALARAAGVADARAGDILDISPDVLLSHDNSAAIRRIFEEIGAPRIVYPERVAITLDHAVPAPTTKHAQNHAEIRAWVREQGISHFFEVGRGICHQVLSEEALILPGETILGADSHTTHFGWLGAFGAGIGRTEMAALWATGELWVRVPEAMRITLTGTLPAGVTSKDLSLRILGDLGVEGGLYRSVEFAGDDARGAVAGVARGDPEYDGGVRREKRLSAARSGRVRLLSNRAARATIRRSIPIPMRSTPPNITWT